jgi:5-methylcytosine-specific restriction endonuclease McrA
MHELTPQDHLDRFYEELEKARNLTIEFLQKYASLPRIRTREEIKSLREEFAHLRGLYPLLESVHRCSVCYNKDGAIQMHHIIPIMCGGGNGLANLVPLCEMCHAKIHPWLLKEQEAVYKEIDSIVYSYGLDYHNLKKDHDREEGYSRQVKKLRREAVAKIVELLDY